MQELEKQANTFEKTLDDIVNERHSFRCRPTRFDEEIAHEQAGERENKQTALP